MRDALSELVTSLDEEGDALAAGDLDRLTESTAKKSALLAELAQLRAAGSTQRQPDRRQLRLARQLNRRNALLLAARMQANGSRLDVLVQAGRGAALYDAVGAVAAGAASLRPRSSA